MKKIVTKRFIKYCIFGTIGGVIEIFAFFVFHDFAHIHYIVANVLSFIIYVLYAYYTNMKFVYKVSDLNKKSRFYKFIIFVLTRLIGLVLDTSVLALCIDVIGIKSVISKMISCASTTVINYFVGKHIFK